jgi:hypothetical protein
MVDMDLMKKRFMVHTVNSILSSYLIKRVELGFDKSFEKTTTQQRVQVRE